MWDEKNEFVGSVVETSGVQNPLGQAGLATFYTGFYYLKAFTYDAVVNTARGFYHSGRTIANADNTEDALMGVAELHGSAGAAAGMVAGVTGSGQIASKIGNAAFIIPMLNGSEAALVTVAIPTGSLVAGAMPGGIGIVMMSASEENGGGNKPEDSAVVQSALEGYRRALINREVRSAADFILKHKDLPKDAELAILKWDEQRLNERLAILLAASRPPSWMARQLQKLSAFCRRVLEKD